LSCPYYDASLLLFGLAVVCFQGVVRFPPGLSILSLYLPLYLRVSPLSLSSSLLASLPLSSTPLSLSSHPASLYLSPLFSLLVFLFLLVFSLPLLVFSQSLAPFSVPSLSPPNCSPTCLSVAFARKPSPLSTLNPLPSRYNPRSVIQSSSFSTSLCKFKPSLGPFLSPTREET